MNFLAHLYLSGNDPEITVGNFMGDFVKGSSFHQAYSPAVARGIMLHRGIDFFTDHHLVVQASKNRLRPKYRHYAGVIVDMFYDHFLAANWNLFHPGPLAGFADEAYKILQHHESILPDRARRVLPYIVKGNWLVGYVSVDGIHQALSGMASRARHESKMDEAVIDLKLHYDDFKNEFLIFFPELQEWVKKEL
jgi:acyl carrier protein phosphodiesterase